MYANKKSLPAEVHVCIQLADGCVILPIYLIEILVYQFLYPFDKFIERYSRAFAHRLHVCFAHHDFA